MKTMGLQFNRKQLNQKGVAVKKTPQKGQHYERRASAQVTFPGTARVPLSGRAIANL